MKSALSQPPTPMQEPVAVSNNNDDDRASKIYKTVEPVPTAPVDIVEKQKKADEFLSNLENVLKNKSKA